MGFFRKIKALFTRRKKVKIGIALGSGGAKGMAHLGVLQAFEEEGIVFDCVAGSSIGAICGALYAKGYCVADALRILETLNKKEFSKNFRPYADMSFIEDFLRQYLEGDFISLPIPFAAWATEGSTNRGVVLDRGDLCKGLTASAAIPPFFRGVELGEKKYYDGAFTNSVPTEVCRQMGAQIVVGVDLSSNQPKEEQSPLFKLFGGALDKISPVKKTEDCISRGYVHADFMIKPDLVGYRAVSISQEAMDEMFERGYQAAKAKMGEIKQMIRKIEQGK